METKTEEPPTRLAVHEFLAVAQCPECVAPLHMLTKCVACGSEFPLENGTPRLFPKKRSQSITYSVRPEDTDPGRIPLSKVLKFPPEHGLKRPDVHRLDIAHWRKIESLAPGARLLEIGCGGGQVRRPVMQRGLKYLGTDVTTTRVVESLRQHGGADVFCDAHFLPFRDGVFDCIYTAAVTEHLAAPHVAVHEIRRVLKPGGFYLGNGSFMEPWHDSSFIHLSPLGVFELLRQADFEIEVIWPELNYLGYFALMQMGNRLTMASSALGRGISAIYRSNVLLKRVARRGGGAVEDVNEIARVTGAMFWIAKKPLKAA